MRDLHLGRMLMTCSNSLSGDALQILRASILRPTRTISLDGQDGQKTTDKIDDLKKPYACRIDIRILCRSGASLIWMSEGFAPLADATADTLKSREV